MIARRILCTGPLVAVLLATLLCCHSEQSDATTVVAKQRARSAQIAPHGAATQAACSVSPEKIVDCRLSGISNKPLQQFVNRDMFGVVPKAQDKWPLLTNNPYNSFSFLFFNVGDLTADSFKGEQDLDFALIDGFAAYYDSIKVLDRYQTAARLPEIVHRLQAAQKPYQEEYDRLCSFQIHGQDQDVAIQSFDAAYDVQSQTVSVPLLGAWLHATVLLSWRDTNQPFYTNTVRLRLPLDVAGRFSKGAIVCRYDYILLPSQGSRYGKNTFKGEKHLLPFGKLIPSCITLTLCDKNSGESFIYNIYAITKERVTYLMQGMPDQEFTVSHHCQALKDPPKWH